MATVWLEDPAAVNGTTGDGSRIFWISVTGTPVFDTSVKNNGLGMWKYDSGAGNTSTRQYTPANTVADAGTRWSVYVYFDTLPPGEEGFVQVAQGGGGNGVWCLTIDSSGVLRLRDVSEAGAQLGSNGATLSAATFYRISGSYVLTSTSNWTINIYVNGSLSITDTNSPTLTRVGGTSLLNGWRSAPGANQIVRFQNLYIDDSAALTDPGGGDTTLNVLHTTSKRPFANGTTTDFTTQIGAGGSGYGSGHAPQVNERVLSVTNGWSMVGAGAAVTEEYTIEGAAVGDVDISASTLVDFMGWVYASSLVSETGQIITNGANSAISLTSTNTLFRKIAASTTYPAGGTDVGIITSTDLTTVSLYEAGVIFAYNYVAPTPATSPIAQLSASGAMCGRQYV